MDGMLGVGRSRQFQLPSTLPDESLVICQGSGGNPMFLNIREDNNSSSSLPNLYLVIAPTGTCVDSQDGINHCITSTRSVLLTYSALLFDQNTDRPSQPRESSSISPKDYREGAREMQCSLTICVDIIVYYEYEVSLSLYEIINMYGSPLLKT